MKIKPLSEIDYASWLKLWKAYQSFYQVNLSEEINLKTWAKLTQQKHQHMYGFAVYIAD